MIAERDLEIVIANLLPAEIPDLGEEDAARIRATSLAYRIRQQSPHSTIAEIVYQSFLRTAWGNSNKRRAGYMYKDHY